LGGSGGPGNVILKCSTGARHFIEKIKNNEKLFSTKKEEILNKENKI
jgi:hypothetical protein